MANRDINLLVRLIADTKGINKGVGQIDSRMKSWGRTVAGLGAGLGLAVGAKEAIQFMDNAIDLANDLEEAQSKIGVVFGESAREVRRWAADSAAGYRLSQVQAADALGSIGALAKGLGFAGDELADVSTTLAELAGDIASFNNVSIDDSILAVLSGLAGESEPLRRFGIDVRKARVETDALAAGLTDATDAQKLFNSITSQAADLGITGDSLRTIDTAVGKQEQLRVKLEDLQTELGQTLAPWKELFVDAALTAIRNLSGITYELDNIGKGLGSKFREFTMQDIRDELGLTQDAFLEWAGNAPGVGAAEDLLEMRVAVEAFANSNAGLELARQMGGLREEIEQFDGDRVLAEVTQGFVDMSETLGDLRGYSIDLGDVFTVEGDLFDFDLGSPKEWVAGINKELRNANVELREFLTNPKARASLEAGVKTMNKRLKTLLNLTTRTANLDTAGGNLMTVFGASVLAKTNKAKGDVGKAMKELGLEGKPKFLKGFEPSTAEWLETLPDSATIQSTFVKLGIAARTGFLSGFGGTASGVVGASSGTSTQPSPAPVSVYVNGDPATIEAAVLRAVRRAQDGGTEVLGNPVRRRTLKPSFVQPY